MNREDQELLAELAQLNTAMAPLTTRNMEDSASAAEQECYAQRLITAGARLQRRADGTGVEDEVLADTGCCSAARWWVDHTGFVDAAPSSPNI